MAKKRKNGNAGGYGHGGGGAIPDFTVWYDSPKNGGFRLTNDK